MGWSSHFDKENNILEITFVGESGFSEIIEAVKHSIEFGRKNNVDLFLADCRQFISKDTNSIFNTYALGKFYDEFVVEKYIREAIIIPDDVGLNDSMSFFETVVQNRGFSIKLFKDAGKGREWLLSKNQK